MPDKLLRHFAGRFAAFAQHLHDTLPAGAERHNALRKLLEAQECALRAAADEFPHAGIYEPTQAHVSPLDVKTAQAAGIDILTGRPLPAGSPYSSAHVPTRQAGAPTPQEIAEKHKAAERAEQQAANNPYAPVEGETIGEFVNRTLPLYTESAQQGSVTQAALHSSRRLVNNAFLSDLTAYMRMRKLGEHPGTVLQNIVQMIDRQYRPWPDLTEFHPDLVEIGTGGAKGEGETLPDNAVHAYGTAEEAIGYWLQHFVTYATDKVGRITWRVRPVLEQFEQAHGPISHKVYSRLMITADVNG